MVCLNVGTRLNGWVPFFVQSLCGVKKIFFRIFGLGFWGFWFFLGGFFIVDVEIYWIIYYIYRNIKMNM